MKSCQRQDYADVYIAIVVVRGLALLTRNSVAFLRVNRVALVVVGRLKL